MGAGDVAASEPMIERALEAQRDLQNLMTAVAVASDARRQAVVALRRAGWTHARIGKLLGLTPGRIANIVNDR
jgi:hypothetical protein